MTEQKARKVSELEIICRAIARERLDNTKRGQEVAAKWAHLGPDAMATAKQGAVDDMWPQYTSTALAIIAAQTVNRTAPEMLPAGKTDEAQMEVIAEMCAAYLPDDANFLVIRIEEDATTTIGTLCRHQRAQLFEGLHKEALAEIQQLDQQGTADCSQPGTVH
jgi:hypothetical protein